MEGIVQMDKNQLQNPVRKYLIGIIACELLLLTMWIELGSDMDVARSVGVKTLLEQTTNGVQEKDRHFFLHHDRDSRRI